MGKEALVLREAMELIKRGEVDNAISIVERAAQAGDPELYSFLGKLMEGGYGAQRNCQQAVAYYQRGIERGDRRFSPNKLGRLYLAGDCVDQDFSRARDLFLVGDLEGDALSSFGLAMSYTLSAQSPEEFRKGRAAYWRALKRGNILSLGLVGENYQREGRIWLGCVLRIAGACIAVPIMLILPGSRFVKTL